MEAMTVFSYVLDAAALPMQISANVYICEQ